MKRSILFVVFLFFLTLPCIASDELGTIDFKTSGSPEAQKEFLRGVLWLHSFEYPDALAAFQKAQQLQPDFAMAYWGEAMTHNHPIWNEREQTQAIAALKKLAPTPEARLQKAPTEKEKDFIRAVDILFQDGEKKERDLAYAEAMEQIYKKYPGDLEAASFYALALLGSCGNVRDFAVYMKAAAVVEEVFAKNPKHPGAAHYLIHSYDDPVHAPLGLRAAREYARIAPSAVHALHMPSHIFLALGMWDDVESSNRASWIASKEKSYHAVYWLQYSLLQQGRFQEALKLLKQVEADSDKEQNSYGRARWHFAAMRAAYVIESQTPFTQLGQSPVKPLSDSLTVDIADIFAAGWTAVRENKIEDANRYHNQIKEALTMEASKSEGQHCKAQSTELSPAELQAAEIMEMELRALILDAQGKKEEALGLMKEATKKEDAMTFEFGPPMPVKPSHELLGEMLIESGRFQEAQHEFELALARAHRRSISISGLAKAAEKAGDATAEKQAKAELQKIRHKGD
jgi:tetratricopeptide (TPR) repeat protein